MRRYVFCRVSSTGKPYRGTDGKYAPAGVLADIGNGSHLNDKGELSWQNFLMTKFEVSLRSAFVALDENGEEINEHDSSRLIWDAMIAILKGRPGKPLGIDELLKEADRMVAAFLRQPAQPFAVVTALSVASLPAKSFTVAGRRVTPLPDGRRRFPLPTVLQSRQHSTYGAHAKETKYQLVRIAAEGRSNFEAIEKGLNTLNVLRGLWSFFGTYGNWSFGIGGPRRKPIGVIHIGPVHTLHHPDGRPAIDTMYWYEPDYTGDQDLFRPDNWAAIESNRRWAMRRIARLPYRTDLEDLLIRYATALDQPNTEIAFLQLWGILEKITNTVGAKYDETIDRTLTLFAPDDRRTARDFLEAARYQRNQYVHSGRRPRESDQIAYLIKSFVDPHLIRLINNAFQVGSLEEYGEFLALPTDKATLQKKRKMIDRAIRAIGRRQDTKRASKRKDK